MITVHKYYTDNLDFSTTICNRDLGESLTRTYYLNLYRIVDNEINDRSDPIWPKCVQKIVPLNLSFKNNNNNK